ncbi:MAG: hypothetical protein GXW99_09345 [Clostridiales bacterium]|nr:hypothetical protein [Clostridiales bacterium]
MKLLPFEQVVNLIQMATLLFLSNWVWLEARRTQEETAVHIFAAGLFSFFLGDLFWTVHLLVKGCAPAVFSPADIAWIGQFVWLFSAVRSLCPKGTPHPWWIGVLPAAVLANYIVWITYMGCEPFTNALWCVAIMLFAWQTGCGLAAKGNRLHPFFVSATAYLLAELLLFLSGGVLYAVMDLLVTVCVVLMSITLLKGVRHAG